MIWISMLLLERKPYQIKGRKVKIIACTLLFICVWALLGTVFYKAGIFRWRYNAGQILFTYMCTAKDSNISKNTAEIQQASRFSR